MGTESLSVSPELPALWRGQCSRPVSNDPYTEEAIQSPGHSKQCCIIQVKLQFIEEATKRKIFAGNSLFRYDNHYLIYPVLCAHVTDVALGAINFTELWVISHQH